MARSLTRRYIHKKEDRTLSFFSSLVVLEEARCTTAYKHIRGEIDTFRSDMTDHAVRDHRSVAMKCNNLYIE